MQHSVLYFVDAGPVFEQITIGRASRIDGCLYIRMAWHHEADIDAAAGGLAQIFAFLVRRHEITGGEPDALPSAPHSRFERDEVPWPLIGGRTADDAHR